MARTVFFGENSRQTVFGRSKERSSSALVTLTTFTLEPRDAISIKHAYSSYLIAKVAFHVFDSSRTVPNLASVTKSGEFFSPLLLLLNVCNDAL